MRLPGLSNDAPRSLRGMKAAVTTLVMRVPKLADGFQVPVGTFSRVCREVGLLTDLPLCDGSRETEDLWRAELVRLFHARRFRVRGRVWLVSCRHGGNFWFLPRGRA